ncbi:hypothetical protein IQ06DRAFT_301544 [Phaeosphaeriaceae sp. SRC1lsM3a]|nr:hypothetical protein IQ06DRAFT_301544 [Stagonospora sp. SRC1lsM3a]
MANIDLSKPLPHSDFTDLTQLLETFTSSFAAYLLLYSIDSSPPLTSSLAELRQQINDIDAHYGWVLAGDIWRTNRLHPSAQNLVAQYEALRTIVENFERCG